MLELYKNIRHLREEKGMSQDTLAKLTGYSDRSSITKIEKGLVDLQQSKIELFAKALNTTTRDLVGWFDEPLPPCDLEKVTPEEAFGGANAYKPFTLAAHFDGDEYSEEELEEIRQFAEFVKSRKK